MANTTVNDLAKLVGTPTERLLQQMQDAGLPHNAPSQEVSDDDKKTLLAYLKTSHGESNEAPKKITLKRKTISTLKAGAGKRTVSVEVRKKRTYIKRDVTQDELQGEADVESSEEAMIAVDEPASSSSDAAALPEPDASEQTVSSATTAEQESEAASEPSVEPEEPVATEPEPPEEQPAAAEVEVEIDADDAPQANPEAEVEVSPQDEFDPEKLRVAAAERRLKAEREAQRLHEEKLVAIKEAEAEAKRRRLAKEKPAVAPVKSKKPAKVDEAVAAAVPEKKRKLKVDSRDDDRGGPKRGRQKMHVRTGGDHSLHIDVKDEYEDAGAERTMHRRKRKHPELQKHAFEKPVEKKVLEVEIGEAISVADLASKMSVKASEVIKFLFTMGSMVTINQMLDQETAELVIGDFGHTVKIISDNVLEDNILDSLGDSGTPEPRPPVVTVMGHVDHGKTSLLDYIRKAKVVAGEAGGITQHIGAYHVETDKGVISFLDTPGHAAFTAMRARGAQSTDIVILVVAADDGVMPQTEEAVNHARAAGVPIIVAINKMDKEQADPDRVKNELAVLEVLPEDWGGDTQFVEVSAHTGDGIDDLLDAILLQSELLELTAPRDVPGAGVVIESSLDKGRGPVANLMIQRGILRKGDIVLAGQHYGRVRAMLDENGVQIESAGPSIPVQILGLDGTADAGDSFIVLENEKRAREVAAQRSSKLRESRHARQQAAKLDNMFSNMAAGQVSVLNIVLKADVRGSLEAIQAALLEQGNDEVKVNIVSGGVGGITESDMNLAITSSAVVFGFNVRADNAAKSIAENEGVDMRYYSVIYDLIDDVKAALVGMLAPELREEILGVADVRETFRSPKFGQVAGCMVVDGTVFRSKPIRVLRDNVVIFEGELESLRRFKDDVAEVRNGFECGIGVKNYDVRVGDKIEVFETREIARQL